MMLYGRGEAVAMNYTASGGYRGGAAYLGKDILGSVRSTSNEYGLLEDRYEYDAFGKPYKGELNEGMNLGYTGKPYDTATGMYNYGYRDYKPEQARFTTVDPIRDGNNWFVYVNNDPVNWIDPLGLEPQPRPLTQAEKDSYTNATGRSIDFDKITVIEGRLPTVEEFKSAAAGAGTDISSFSDKEISDNINRPGIIAYSFPDGTIYTKNANPSSNLMDHELNHQDTYQNGATTTYGGQTQTFKTSGEVFGELIKEALTMPDPYAIPGTLEYQADHLQKPVQQQNTNQPQGSGLKGK